MCLDQSPRRFIAAWLSCYLKGVLDIYTCRPPWPPSIQGHQLVAGLLFGFLGGNSTTKRTFKKKNWRTAPIQKHKTKSMPICHISSKNCMIQWHASLEHGKNEWMKRCKVAMASSRKKMRGCCKLQQKVSVLDCKCEKIPRIPYCWTHHSHPPGENLEFENEVSMSNTFEGMDKHQKFHEIHT